MLTYVNIMDFHGDSTPQKDDPANEGFFRVGEPPGTRRSSFISPMSQTAPHSVSETTQLKD
jgi:hypothetical protein